MPQIKLPQPTLPALLTYVKHHLKETPFLCAGELQDGSFVLYGHPTSTDLAKEALRADFPFALRTQEIQYMPPEQLSALGYKQPKTLIDLGRMEPQPIPPRR